MAKARRGQNEGSIHKRKDGRWVAVLNLGYAEGKRRRKCLYGKTRREVQEKLTAALWSQRLGVPVPTERQTVAQFLNRWLKDSVERSVRPRTYASYSQLVRLYLAPEFNRVELTKLSPQDIEGFMNRKLAAGLSRRTDVLGCGTSPVWRVLAPRGRRSCIAPAN